MQLLAGRDYAGISIREIVSVAGTGLGSFYEYFASKDDLARVCLHLRSKALLAALQAAGERCAGQPLADVAAAVVDALADAHRGPASEWDAHYLLERHLSGAEAYRKMYERFVDGWAQAFAGAADPLPAGRLREAALLSHTLAYGLFSNAFIGSRGQGVDVARLGCCARDAVLACVAAAAQGR
ncbi:transcriptional regulator, TetR family [Variovorax sp. OV329]|nr:transcriptional regulator, TetR family [Variovorax sp. OV329]